MDPEPTPEEVGDIIAGAEALLDSANVLRHLKNSGGNPHFVSDDGTLWPIDRGTLN